MNKVFGFDVGLGSLGIAVREGNEMQHAASLLMDSEFASIGDQADRRRFHRTKQAHKAREKYWETIWEEIKKVPLKGRRHQKNSDNSYTVLKGDEQLEREFPAKGDDTVYTSCLLRIKLLEGDELEDWQIYKAIRSALQRRGYDKDLPWKSQVNGSDKLSDKEMNPASLAGEFDDDIKKYPQEYQYPCYYEAHKMGLWDPKTGIMNIQIDREAGRARGRTTPRYLVEKELRQLLENAAKIIPALKKKQIEKILYGEAAAPYKYDKEHKGLLAQKLPRFDNRCVSHCCLIPRYRVVRSADIINQKVNFLISLARMTYHTDEATEDGNLVKNRLTTTDIKYWYNKANDKIKLLIIKNKKDENSISVEKLSGEINKCLKIGKREWKTWLQNEVGNGSPVVNYEEMKPPKTDGRSRYSKPALVLMEELILSGKNPADFYKELNAAIDSASVKDKNDKDFGVKLEKYKFRLKKQDISFLLKIQYETGGIYIPSISIAEKYFAKNEESKKSKDLAIWKLIGSTQNYVVRHRLAFFYTELQKLSETYGKPDKVVFEFARDEFMGEKKKREHIKYMKEREGLYKNAKAQMKDDGLAGGKTAKKITLLQEQDYMCPFASFFGLESKSCLARAKVEDYEIEHIIPQGSRFNGPDAIWNLVLTSAKVNSKKGERAPYEIIPKEEWAAYSKHIGGMKKLDGKKKKILLASSKEEVDELMEKYYGLAITGMVARMARDLTCLYFDWQPGDTGERQKVIVVTGGLVAKIRRKYRLDKILGDWENNPNPMKKDRQDRRHHALDAMVISYLPQWAANKDKSKFFKFPDGIDDKYFAQKISKVFPEYRRWVRASLAEQPLGRINIQGTDTEVLVTRKELEQYLSCEAKDFKKKGNALIGRINKVIDPNIRKQLLQNLNEIIDGIELNALDKEDLSKICEQWNKHIADNPYRQSNSKGGSIIRRIRVRASSEGASHTMNLSKDRWELGYRGQHYYSAKTSSVGTMQHGFYIVKINGKFDIKPVYSFLSPANYLQKLQNEGYEVYKNTLFRRRKVWIEVADKIINSQENILPGAYLICSFSKDYLYLEDQTGRKYKKISANKLFSSGRCEIINLNE